MPLIFIFILLIPFTNYGQDYEIEIPFENDKVRFSNMDRIYYITFKPDSSYQKRSNWTQKIRNFKDYEFLNRPDERFFQYRRNTGQIKQHLLFTQANKFIVSSAGKINYLENGLFSYKISFSNAEEWQNSIKKKYRKEFKPGPFPDRITVKTAICDINGKMIFPPIFDHITPYGKFIIGSSGRGAKYLIKPRKRKFKKFSKYGKVTYIRVEDYIGIFHRTELSIYDDKLNLVYEGITRDNEKGLRYSLVNNNLYILYCENNFAVAKVDEDNNKKWAIIDQAGKNITPYKYNGISKTFGAFRFYIKSEDGQAKYGYFDEDWNEIFFGKPTDYFDRYHRIHVAEGKAFLAPFFKEIKTPKDYYITQYIGLGVFIAKSKETGKDGSFILKEFLW